MTVRKIRVLHIITRLDAGGSATNTLETVRRLDPARFEVDLISGRTVDPSGQVEAFIARYGIRCLFIDDLLRDLHPLKDLKAFVRLFLEIRRGRYDIVHTHSSKAGIIGRWAARLAGVTYVVHTPHGHVFYGYFSRFTTGIFIMLERMTALLTDKLIELTQKGVDEHVALGIGTKAQWSVVPSGIDLDVFKPNEEARVRIRQEFGIADDEVLVMSVGRLEPVKGHRYLVDALPCVLKQCPHARFMFIGDGQERAALERQAHELGVQNRIIFTGTRHDVAACLNGADIFSLASLNEGMGRAVVEAMSCGKPVVLSRVGGMADLIDHGKEGFFCPPNDSVALAQALVTLAMDKPKRDMMSAHAVQRAQQGFSIETMVRKLEDIYGAFV